MFNTNSSRLIFRIMRNKRTIGVIRCLFVWRIHFWRAWHRRNETGWRGKIHLNFIAAFTRANSSWARRINHFRELSLRWNMIQFLTIMCRQQTPQRFIVFRKFLAPNRDGDEGWRANGVNEKWRTLNWWMHWVRSSAQTKLTMHLVNIVISATQTIRTYKAIRSLTVATDRLRDVSERARACLSNVFWIIRIYMQTIEFVVRLRVFRCGHIHRHCHAWAWAASLRWEDFGGSVWCID